MIYYSIITIALIAGIVIAGRSIMTYAESKNAKSVVNWFMILSILNVVIFMFLIGTYGNLRFMPGPRGPDGTRGIQGYQGKNGSCAMCKPDAPGLRPIRTYNKMDSIDPMHPSDMMEQLFPRR
jgi:hypothetical protein